jgi:DHA2 family multidrug resistance protein-like MFS transporter
VVVGAAAPLAAVLAPRLGRPAVMAAGFVVSVVGFLMVSRVEPTSGLWLVLVAAALVSGGLVAVLSLITDYVVGVAPAERAGSVAGLVETSSELGGALGMALLGSVLAAVYRTQADLLMPFGLPASAAAEAGQTLGGAVAVAAHLPASIGQAVLDAGRAAYTSAMHAACLTAAGVLVLAAVVTVVMLRGGEAETAPAQEQARVS